MQVRPGDGISGLARFNSMLPNVFTAFDQSKYRNMTHFLLNHRQPISTTSVVANDDCMLLSLLLFLSWAIYRCLILLTFFKLSCIRCSFFLSCLKMFGKSCGWVPSAEVPKIACLGNQI